MATDRTIVYTTAPENYDYGYATTLETFESGLEYTGQTYTFRKVALDTDYWHVRYQCERYNSGMYLTQLNDPRLGGDPELVPHWAA